MKTKYFYNAFNILYDLVKESLGIFQKEELYRQLFQAIYVMSGDALYDNDSIRKITSGNQTIHLRAVKKLHTPEGFEKFRRDIERVCLTNINSPVDVANKLLEQCEQVSEETGRTIKSSFNDDTPYQISRAVAAVLIFLNHADYASSKGKHTVLNIDFMRLGEEQPLLSYPKFITNIPNAAVDRLVGRIDEINEVYQEIVEGDGKLMVTGVGGLGKTVVVQQFLNKLQNTPTEESQIEKIAWIPYDNHDICLSMKQALHLKCDLEDVWQAVQDLCADSKGRLLFVIDNIENIGNDEFLGKLSMLPCRVLITSRQKILRGFNRIMYLPPLKMAQCRDLFYQHYQYTSKFSVSDLAYSYRNKADLLLQFDRAEEASAVLEAIEELFDENNSPQEDREILNSQYGILYQIRGDYKKSRGYFEKCIDAAEKSEGETRNKDISTACSNMARMLVDAGDFFEAYDYIKRAINAEDEDANDSDQIICYSTLAAICTELMNAGFGTTYVQEGYDAFMKVIKFRKEKLGNHHADTAVIYHDFAYFWYIAGDYDKALKYNEMARSIEEELFAEYSITRMRSLNTKALVVWEQGKHQDADDIFEYIITTSEQMSSDYLPDVADFLFNYARCLHDQDEDEKAKAQYLKCINIWSEMSEDGNRKLALAHQEIADIFFSENNAADALEHYVLAEKFNAEDFYVEVDVLDSVAACLLLLDKPEEGIQKFKELLEILVKYKANDTEAKFQLCNNLFCIIDAESEEEIELREMLMEQIKDEPATVEYVHNFLTNREEK